MCVLTGVYVPHFIVCFAIIQEYPFLSLDFAGGLDAPGSFILAACLIKLCPYVRVSYCFWPQRSVCETVYALEEDDWKGSGRTRTLALLFRYSIHVLV